MLYAVALGLVCGLLCLNLPDDIRSVIVNDIAKPVQSVCLSMLMGVMAPVILSPLLEGNIPQLVVLGLALGAALLMLEDKVDGLKDILSQVSKWSMSLMGIVMIIKQRRPSPSGTASCRTP